MIILYVVWKNININLFYVNLIYLVLKMNLYKYHE